MAEPIGISFMPSAEAAANGPQQAGIEGQGGSDLAQAFKILSLHLPRVLGAGAIAPRRLLTSPGSAGVSAPSGVSPYGQVFQALLQALGGGASMGGTDSLSSLYGMPSGGYGGYGGSDEMSSGGGFQSPTSAPPPLITPAGDGGRSVPDVYGGGSDTGSGSVDSGGGDEPRNPDTYYI